MYEWGKVMKLCKKCGETKEYGEFHKMTKSSDGLQHWCKVCLNSHNNLMIELRKKNGPTVTRTSKTCQRCKNLKPVSQFAKKTGAADGYVSYCKPCWVIKIRGYQIKAKNNGR